MSRGRRGEVVFLEEKDCLEFMNLLKEACRIKEKVDNEPRADLTPIQISELLINVVILDKPKLL